MSYEPRSHVTGSGTLALNGFTLTAPASGTVALVNATSFSLPIIVSVKNIAVQTSGSAVDIATIVLPAWLTRYKLGVVGTSGVGGGLAIVGESMAGTLAGAAFVLSDAAGGVGTAYTLSLSGPASTGVSSTAGVQNPTSVYTANTIYIRQTANSANAGVVSFYLLIMPLL